MDALRVLADNNFGDTRSGSLAGPMGLFIIVLLAIGTVLLIRNMNARIRRLPDHFPDPEAGPERDSTGGPGTSGPGAGVDGAGRYTGPSTGDS